MQKIRKKQLWLLFKQKLVGNGRERDKNTKYRFVSFRSYPVRNRKLQTNSKKNQKIIKHYWDFISSQNKGGNAEKWRKQKLPSCSVPTGRVIENSRKIGKNLKNTIVASFQAIIGWNRQRNRESKSYLSVSFQPDA